MTAKVDESQKRLYIELGKRIKNARDSKHLSQAGLADASFLSRTSITNIEKGRQHLPLHTLYVIANALQVNIVELLPDQNQTVGRVFLENVPRNLQQKDLEWIQEVVSTSTNKKKR